MWTIGGYAQDFIKRHVAKDEMFTDNREHLLVAFITTDTMNNDVAGLVSIIICCPVKDTVHSYQIEALIDRIKEQLELPLGQWNISKSDVDGCMKLCIRFGKHNDSTSINIEEGNILICPELEKECTGDGCRMIKNEVCQINPTIYDNRQHRG